MYSLGESERVVGKALLDYARREEFVLATKVFNPMGDGPNDRGLSRKHISTLSTPPWSASALTMSTFTRFTAGTMTLRSKKPWKPCMTW